MIETPYFLLQVYERLLSDVVKNAPIYQASKRLIHPGKLVFHIFAALAEFEKSLIRQRVMAGLEASRKMGTKFGRPESLTAKDKEMAITMFNGGATKNAIAQHFGVARQTIYALLKQIETI